MTEAVTGLDLVELQLRVASGESLPITQDDVSISGHAIEVRVVAEDPSADWMPSVGVVTAFAVDPSVRTDTGFRAGSEVSSDYDSLLAKVIAHAPTRRRAASQMARALRTATITGVATNVPALKAIMSEADFLAAKTPTAYLTDHPEVTTTRGPGGDERLALLLGAVFAEEFHQRKNDTTTGFAPSGYRNQRTTGQRQTWTNGIEEFAVEYDMHGSQTATVLVGAWPTVTDDGTLTADDRRSVAVRLLNRTTDRQVLEMDGYRQVIDTARLDGQIQSTSRFGSLAWRQLPRFTVPEKDESGSGPISPLPGTVIAVMATEGQHVSDGDTLMVVEAMKMEHKITATSDAQVLAVRFAVGDRVDTGDLLVELLASDEEE